MVDWSGIGRTALWVSGLAVMLATWSWNEWWAHVHGQKLRPVLGEARFQVPFSVGMVLFCVGMALGERIWWRIGLWCVLALLFVWQGAQAWRARADTRDKPSC